MIRRKWFEGLPSLTLAFALAAGGCSTTSGGLIGGAEARTSSPSGVPLVRLHHDHPEGIDLSSPLQSNQDGPDGR